MRRIIALLAVTIVLLTVPSVAMASGGSTCQAYNPQLCDSVSPSSSTDAQRTLPFTGVNVALVVAGGVGLLGAGLAVRRLAHHIS